MKPETKRTFKVAIQLCLVCSVVVSALAVGLKPIQEEQKEAFRQQSILSAAGLWEDGADAGQLYEEHIGVIGLDLEDDKPEDDDLKSPKFDLAKALQNPEWHHELPPSEDVAGLKEVENYSVIYQVPKEGRPQKIILPIRGKGLWSTLYGFITLDVSRIQDGPEHVKVAGLTYYKHGETPGLGGEVDNDLWKAKWPDKLVFDEHWDVKVKVAKNAAGDYQVDALSGATLTSNGVSNMLKFWLGDDGFGPYLQRLAQNSTAAVNRPATF
ncbi:MAG: Na(+)-translocating NADH-quinone reductase subunit C [Planctomycetaceae bacterium]